MRCSYLKKNDRFCRDPESEGKHEKKWPMMLSFWRQAELSCPAGAVIWWRIRW